MSITPEEYELLPNTEKVKYINSTEIEYQAHVGQWCLVKENPLHYIQGYHKIREKQIYVLKYYDANQVEDIIKKVLERVSNEAKKERYAIDEKNHSWRIDKQSILTIPYKDLL